MTVDRGRHEAWEELVSAGITGDVTADERHRLEAHLASCATCRATWDAFMGGRRVVGGLRHYAPPRDLGARVRAGIESGAFSRTPWWRRGPAIFAGVGGSLAVVAGALLALVLLDDGDPNVATSSATPSVAVSSPSASLPSTPAPASDAPPSPSATPANALPPTPGPSQEPDPEATPTPVPSPPPALASSPEPDLYLAVTGDIDNQAVTLVEGTSGEPIGEPEVPAEAPVAAAMTDDGEWLAYITQDAFQGLQAVRVTHLERVDDPDEGDPITIEETLPVNEEGVAAGPFLGRLEWSRDGRYLAYTVANPETGTDAWIYDTTRDEARQLTSTGASFAASFLPPRDDEDTAVRLWVSTAGTTPTSHILQIADGDLADWEPVDPAEAATVSLDGVFQPLLSPNSALVIYWTGTMVVEEDAWVFGEGGSPILAEHRMADEDEPSIENGRNLFGDVTVGRDGFRSASIAWGPDGDTIAVWQAQWQGLPQSAEGTYPDPGAVYFGRATEPGGLTSAKAIDALDVAEGARVIDVKVAPTGRHLLVTVAYPVDGTLGTRTADLLLVEVLADADDIVETLNEDREGWFGPAAFSAPRSDNSQAP